MALLNQGDLLDGRYRIDTPIAKGGMSVVYRCIDMRLGRAVAAKVLNEEFAGDELFRARFRREARSMARLSHPCLVNVYDTSSSGEHVFLIMELITGGTLRELLAERGPMPPYAAAAVLRPMLTGLAVAHQAGMIHRDIKPDNVLINADHQVKLADFGLVRGTNRGDEVEQTIMGTAAYLSPEQVRGQQLSQSSDVFAAGVVLYELLTGQTPFGGDSLKEVAYARLSQRVPAPSGVIDGVPPEFDELVLRATEPESFDRFGDAGEFLEALDGVARAVGLHDFEVPVPTNAAAHRASAVPTEFTDLLTAQIDRCGEQSDGVADAATEVLPQSAAGVAADAEPTSIIAGHQPGAQQVSGVDETAVIPAQEYYPEVEPETAVYPSSQPAAEVDVAPAQAPRPHYVRHDEQEGLAGPGRLPQAPAVVDEPPELAPVRNRSAVSVVLWIVIVVLLLGTLGLGGWWLGSGRYGDIPIVVGQDSAQAVVSLEQAGFSPETVKQYSDTVPVAEVIGTEPAGGERLPKGRTVRLLLSLGRPTVPDYPADRDVQAFYEQLSQRTLVPTRGEDKFSDEVPAGQVVSTEPPPGAALNVGAKVIVHVSKGPAPVKVPDLKNVTVDKARQLLDKAGLIVGNTREEFDPNADGGNVAGSSPAAGEELLRGSSVDLIVSTALKVPKVAGLSKDTAEKALQDAGLRVGSVTYSDKPARAATVVESYPAAGERVDPAYPDVDLVLPAKVQVPSVTGKKVKDARSVLEKAGFKVDADGAGDGARVITTSPKSGEDAAAGSTVVLKTLG
ncbi:PASTA domain-containing protein [Corynebacterium aquilae]|uniref:non-specific serine/threonine protein kinase n=1 Tax=Corynebacterium aquilae DSM 44791 TaxID=1431546 RepID=A0A1L7CGZ6_9CORY|nr:PASTA domain-containing protein [Corynebacterium aquilae]APT85104.1 hypothetical protein CAQU_08515 [Corynebacterium aquilae DSM 44791]